jgi:Cu/Ag efflux protein CusF
MPRILMPLAVSAASALLLAGCSSGPTVYGGIQKIDPTAHTITLYNTTTFQVDPAMDLSKFKVGDPVVIAYNVDPQTKKNLARSVAPL